MPTLDEVYRKYGETAEAAQLLETALGNTLLVVDVLEEDLLAQPDPLKATAIFDKVNRKTLGQLLSALKGRVNTPEGTDTIDGMESLLVDALIERNRLQHSFYRKHNFRRNSVDGRELMLKDLESIHNTIIDAYKAVMRLSGFDLDASEMQDIRQPTKHLPI